MRGAVHIDDIPDDLAFKAEYMDHVEGWVNPGLSVIVDLRFIGGCLLVGSGRRLVVETQ